MYWYERLPVGLWYALAALFVVLQAAALWQLGQPWVCECGTIKLWYGVVFSGENSQQLTDWYTLSHVIHGLLLYFVLTLLFPRTPVWIRLTLALGLEAGWEIFENTHFVIDRYRQQALAAGYVGDSIINSLVDTLAAVAGLIIAWRMPVRVSIFAGLFLEALMLYVIRDNLLLNTVQLIHPMEWLSAWQSGG